MSMKALEHYLKPLMPFLNADGVTEICINRPKELFIEKQGQFIRHVVSELEYPFLQSLAALVAEFNNEKYPAPLISGSLPSGERIQFVLPPVSEKGKIVCSIRRHQIRNMSLADHFEQGVFFNFTDLKKDTGKESLLRAYFNQQDNYRFIEMAVKHRKNILISGGTGTGKTTFLNACLKSVPSHERLITIEDTREVKVEQSNAAHLLFNEDEKELSALNVFKSCLRLRPDRILLSELRGAEVWPFLRAANSGHPGRLSTVHADTPEGAISQLVFMMQQAGSTSTEEQLRNYIKSTIHVVIQLRRHPDPKRFMRVEEIWFGK